LSGRYVEVVWSEIMGPTATLLARRLSDFIEVNPNGGEISIAGLGRTLGVPPSKVRSALSRMGRHGLISLRPERVSVGISGLVPSVGHSRLAELSENAQREHRRQVDSAVPTSGGESARHGARFVRAPRAVAPGRTP